MSNSTLIHFEQVDKLFGSGNKTVQAVSNANVVIRKGEAFGLVGESGSGKSTLGKMLIGLEHPTYGSIKYQGSSLWDSKGRFKSPRPGEIQIVFQDPQSSLNPRMTVRDIILEPLFALSPAERKEKGSPERLRNLIQRVGLKAEHLSRYPHEFSGGQRQRIAIARALITDPSFLVLDEPTSALDVSVQAQVLNLLKELKKERNLTYLFISHNMSVIRYMCDRIAVMYKGNLVEIGPSRVLFEHPGHPYTTLLLSSLPSVFQDKRESTGFAPTLEPIGNKVLQDLNTKKACIFYEKCPSRVGQCLHAPPLQQWGDDHYGTCHIKEVSGDVSGRTGT